MFFCLLFSLCLWLLLSTLRRLGWNSNLIIILYFNNLGCKRYINVIFLCPSLLRLTFMWCRLDAYNLWPFTVLITLILVINNTKRLSRLWSYSFLLPLHLNLLQGCCHCSAVSFWLNMIHVLQQASHYSHRSSWLLCIEISWCSTLFPERKLVHKFARTLLGLRGHIHIVSNSIFILVLPVIYSILILLTLSCADISMLLLRARINWFVHVNLRSDLLRTRLNLKLDCRRVILSSFKAFFRFSN